MNIEWSYIIVALSCAITALMIAYKMGNRKNESSLWLLESRVKTLEKELSCLRVLVRMNLPRFSDQLSKIYEEFEKKLNIVDKQTLDELIEQGIIDER